MLKIKKKDMAVLIAATALAGISLLARDTIAQRMLYLCAMVVGVGIGYVLSKHLGRGKCEILLYCVVVVLSTTSLLLGWNTFTHGRWLVTSVMNLYIPGLFPLAAPFVVWLKEQKKLLLAVCAWGDLVLISLLMNSVDGLILCAGVLTMLVWEKKAFRITVLFLASALLGLLIWHQFNIGMTAVLDDINYSVAKLLYRWGFIPYAVLSFALGMIFSGLSDARNRNLRNVFMIFIVVRAAVHYICIANKLETRVLISMTELPFMGHATSNFTDYTILVWALLNAHTKEEAFLLKDDCA